MRTHGEMVRVEVGEDRLRVAVSRFVGTEYIIVNLRTAFIACDVAYIFVRIARGLSSSSSSSGVDSYRKACLLFAK